MKIRAQALQALRAHAAADPSFARKLRVSPSQALASIKTLEAGDRAALRSLGTALPSVAMGAGGSGVAQAMLGVPPPTPASGNCGEFLSVTCAATYGCGSGATEIWRCQPPTCFVTNGPGTIKF